MTTTLSPKTPTTLTHPPPNSPLSFRLLTDNCYNTPLTAPLMATSSSRQFSHSAQSLLSSSSARRLLSPRSSIVPQPRNSSSLKSSGGFRGVSFQLPNRGGSAWWTKASLAEMTTEKDKAGRVEVFESEEDLAVSLAKYTADLADKFSRERGSFSVVVSGGSLIKSLRKLTEAPYVDSVDWSRWHMFWVDERVVPKDHVDSNYKLAYDGFLSKVPILPGHVYSINDALSAEGAADDYETCLRHLVKSNVIGSSTSGFPKFDLMLLGMGPDGHVASLFPGHPLAEEKEKWVTFITDSPKPPPERITFTFPVINSSAYIALVVVGAGKAGPVQAAVGKKSQDGDVLPVQRVSPEGELIWFLDKDAASKL